MPKPLSSESLISVIIPAYNEVKLLPGCLKSLENQSAKDFEVIVVDDGSTDGTAQFLSSYHPAYHLIVVKGTHRGAGVARNLGVKHAAGEILVFIDADMEVDSKYLEILTAPIIKKGIIGTFTKDEFVGNYNNHWARCWNWEYTGVKSDRRVSADHPASSNVFRAIQKSAFDKVNGYDEIGYGEDWTISAKLNEQARLAVGAIVYHYNPDSGKAVFAQAMWFTTRGYKFGELGRLIGLLRASLPFSFLFALFGMFKYRSLFYVIFKLTYDLGIFAGIIKYWITGRVAE